MRRFLYLGGLEDILNGLRDLRTDTITLNQGNSVLALYSKETLSVLSR